MAGELVVSGTASYRDDNGVSDSVQVLDLSVDIASPGMLKFVLNVPITDTRMFSDVITTSFRWIMMVNLDTVNYVEIKSTSSGIYNPKLLPGEFAMFPIGSGFSDPYAKAHTAPVKLLVLLLPL